MNYTNIKYLAQYDCSTYGAGAYSNGQVCASTTTNTTTTPAGTADGGKLAYTGADVIAPLSAGLILITAAVALLVRNIKSKKSAITAE